MDTKEARNIVIDKVKSLPTLPDVIHKVLSLVQGEDATAKALGDLISYDQAISAFSTVIQFHPEGCITSLYNRGKVYTVLGYYEMAIDDYTRAIEIDPEHINARYYRGMVYYYLEDTEKADADYERAVQLAGFRPSE